MGHDAVDLMSPEEHQRSERFYEALDFRGKLYDVPLSSLTFGELSFLLDLFEFRPGRGIRSQELERLCEIAERVEAT